MPIMEGEGLRVLIVDDNPTNRRIVEKLVLMKFGHAISDLTLADSAQATLELAAEKVFDLILLDINLGEGMDGVEVARKIRNMEDGMLEENQDCDIVAVTTDMGLPEVSVQLLWTSWGQSMGKAKYCTDPPLLFRPPPDSEVPGSWNERCDRQAALHQGSGSSCRPDAHPVESREPIQRPRPIHPFPSLHHACPSLVLLHLSKGLRLRPFVHRRCLRVSPAQLGFR